MFFVPEITFAKIHIIFIKHKKRRGNFANLFFSSYLCTKEVKNKEKKQDNYGNINNTPDMNQMLVTFDDVSIMNQVKKTLSLIQGVKSISMPRKKRMSGLDRALKDVEEGRVTRWNSVEEMFQALSKD